MFDYTAYGLHIQSELQLPELIAAPGSDPGPVPRTRATPSVHILLAPVDRHQPDRGAGHSSISTEHSTQASAWATPDAAILDYPNAACFLIRNGEQIVIDAAPDADPSLIRLYLLGPVLALLLHQRNFLVLHASAVNVGGEVIAFVGDKGMGKSTLAAAFHARGHALVADDLVAVDTNAPQPVAYPGFPQLKLFPESAALLDGDPRHLPRVHPNLDKRARRVAEGFATEPQTLGRIFVLHDSDADLIEPMPVRQGFMELIRHSYLLGYLGATESAASHFHQAVALAGRVTVARLHRRRLFDALPGVVRLVEESRERAA